MVTMPSSAVVSSTPEGKERWQMSPELLAQVLIPYRDHCKYLKKLSMEYLPPSAEVSKDASEASIVAIGELSIGESCYIDSTGHFNAVEFQICANQLMYAMGAECTRRRMIRAFEPMDLGGYYERQLANVLITNVTSAFRKVMNPRRFRGRLQLDRAYCIRDRAFLECTITYTDDEGGLADGNIIVTMSLGEKLPPKG
jgi:hypothetical protein